MKDYPKGPAVSNSKVEATFYPAPTPLRFIDPTWVTRTKLLDSEVLFALYWQDGSIGIEHPCRTTDLNEQLICAPKLTADHVVHSQDPDPLTVTPSILCPDCGLHGYVTDDVWRNADVEE